MGSSFEISYWSERICTGTWGLQLYVGFCIAAGALGAVATATFVPVKCATDAVDCVPPGSPENGIAMWAVIIITAVVIGWIICNHCKAVSFDTYFREAVIWRADDFGYDRF